MKITAQEEYGLRILIRIAGCRTQEGMSIPQISETEGLSSHYVGETDQVTAYGRIHQQHTGL
jgi:Rrf2 family iron-sulfur cluster assembly transcriptional regulator